jgi:hypothetical protein
MRTFLLWVLFFCLVVSTAFAQHEADNWYFGDFGGITFRNGAPTPLSDGKLVSQEGCAILSDKITGALLFYTNGVSVWNNKHQIMSWGTDLAGGVSSMQNALIVPNLANNLQYYIFTARQAESGETGLYYTLVSLETPNGKILTKNTFLLENVGERLTGTLDCSGTGYWVITDHNYAFYAYHLTDKGLDSTPIVSPYSRDADNQDIGGYIKISPDRTKLALSMALFDFNDATGHLAALCLVTSIVMEQLFLLTIRNYIFSVQKDTMKLDNVKFINMM